MPRPRLRTFTLWTGTLLSLLIAAAFVVSARWFLALFIVPLCVVFLSVAVPTLLAWRFWPKPVKPGHCRCGYNLTGLTEPRCPECGQPFEPKGDAP